MLKTKGILIKARHFSVEDHWRPAGESIWPRLFLSKMLARDCLLLFQEKLDFYALILVFAVSLLFAS